MRILLPPQILMGKVEKLRRHTELSERSDGKDRDDHHDRGKPGTLFAISKIDFHGSGHKSAVVWFAVPRRM